MPIARYERVAQDLAGNALGGATVDVFFAGTTSRPTLYADENGSTTKPNPFTADSNGYFYFYVADGNYDVKVTHGPASVTYQNQQIYSVADRVKKSGDTMTGQLSAPTVVVGADPGGGEKLRAETLKAGSSEFRGPVAIKTSEGQLVVYNDGSNPSAPNASIEMGRTDGVAAAAYIDFHTGAVFVDFDSRIHASGGTGAIGGGKLTVHAGAFGVFASLGVRTDAPSADLHVVGDEKVRNIYPEQGDNTGQIGSNTARWSLVRAVTIQAGDYVFENGWRLVEAENLGLRSGIALVRPDGTIAAVWN